MEYAAGGELFDRIVDRGRFSEDEVHYIIIIGSSLSIILYPWYSSYPPHNGILLFFLLLIVGQIFLPAVDLWSELLPSHGM